jgi:hypothetical protein
MIFSLKGKDRACYQALAYPAPSGQMMLYGYRNSQGFTLGFGILPPSGQMASSGQMARVHPD